MAIIRTFFDRLPCWIDEPTRAQAEDKLAQVAANYRPDELQRFADWYAAVLNPDGDFSDEDRARKRGVSIGPQGNDGMSAIKGWLDPELRAGLDAVLAKWAAPGMCNPADEKPTIEGEPVREAVDADYRSAAQRNHDALNAIVRSTLMSGELGSHQGLPVTIVATVALSDLQAKAGVAPPAGGTLLPVTDSDPDGRPRRQLSADLRRRQTLRAVQGPQHPAGHPRPTAGALCDRARLHPSRL